MRFVSVRIPPRPISYPSTLQSMVGIALASVLTLGCGSSGPPPSSSGSGLAGNTTVTVLTTSTANDKFTAFGTTLNSLTLTSQSGKSVILVGNPIDMEFIHVNGTAEPLAKMSIPQGTYTSATASFGPSAFTCNAVGPSGGEATSTFGLNSVPAGSVKVNMPAPITISGASMALSLNLLVSQSASYTTCVITGIEPYSLTPTFSLSPVASSGEGAQLNGLEGIISSMKTAGNGFVVASADGSNYGGGDPTGSMDPANGPNWQVAFNSSTAFQGLHDSMQLTAGMAIDMDATLQPDGSLLATRIAVYDTNTANLSLWNGPLVHVDNVIPALWIMPRQQIGPLLSGFGTPTNTDNAVFGISGQFTNLASLPFTASFTAQNMVPGQIVEETFHDATYPRDASGPSPATVILLPQTIDGTVSSISSSGGFTAYTVTLAPYDLFPVLAVQVHQTTLLNDPSTVVVYADNSTRMLNTNSISVGSIMRFNGLVFNDNGTLRMDCAQVNDGVAE